MISDWRFFFLSSDESKEQRKTYKINEKKKQRVSANTNDDREIEKKKE